MKSRGPVEKLWPTLLFETTTRSRRSVSAATVAGPVIFTLATGPLGQRSAISGSSVSPRIHSRVGFT